MKILSKPIRDTKIQSYNFLVEMTIREYFTLVNECLNKNDFQRSRVRSSKTIYSLLKQDLIKGCIIPPIVLSLGCSSDENKFHEESYLENLIKNNTDDLLILDGLQRTYTIKDIIMQAQVDDDAKSALENIIRVEIYLGLNREGVLYRMLTLNTGQTPMNLRHQVEIIYSSLLDKDFSGYKLIRDNETIKNKVVGYYKFSDAIDCFTSYMEGDYLQINREKLLDTIKSFDNISKLSSQQDLFDDLMKLYTKFAKIVENEIKTKQQELGKNIIEALDNIDSPFGKDAFSIFDKSQPMTGFGAAVSRILEINPKACISDLYKELDKLKVNKIIDALSAILYFLDKVRSDSKKIGNSQRCFFYYFFKALFDDERNEFLDPYSSVEKAIQDYNRDY